MFTASDPIQVVVSDKQVTGCIKQGQTFDHCHGLELEYVGQSVIVGATPRARIVEIPHVLILVSAIYDVIVFSPSSTVRSSGMISPTR